MAAIHFLNQVSDFSGSYAFGVELDNRAFQNIRVLLVVRQRVLIEIDRCDPEALALQLGQIAYQLCGNKHHF